MSIIPPIGIVIIRGKSLDGDRTALDATQEAFLSAAENALKLYQEKVLRLESVLHALGPNSILERGFSITFDEEGEIVKDPKKLKKGDRIESMLRHGNLSSRVE